MWLQWAYLGEESFPTLLSAVHSSMDLEGSIPKETRLTAIKELRLTGVKRFIDYPRVFRFKSSFPTQGFSLLLCSEGVGSSSHTSTSLVFNLIWNTFPSIFIFFFNSLLLFTIDAVGFLLLLSRRSFENINWSSSLWNWQHLCIAFLGSLLETSVVSNQVQGKQNTGRTEREAYQNHGTPWAFGKASATSQPPPPPLATVR